MPKGATAPCAGLRRYRYCPSVITSYSIHYTKLYEGNHECYQQILPEDSIEEAWLKSIGYSLTGMEHPEDEAGFTYSFVYNGSLFIGLDEYMHANATKDSIIYVNQKWLDYELLV